MKIHQVESFVKQGFIALQFWLIGLLFFPDATFPGLHLAPTLFYSYPKKHWRFIRTNNIIERTFGEVKKRSHKMAAAFRNENSCMLMFYAVIRSLKLRSVRVLNNW